MAKPKGWRGESRRHAEAAKKQRKKLRDIRDKPVVLTHDGKVIGRFKTENEALMFLHNYQGQSWDYAFKYGGYKMIVKGKK